MRDHAFGQTKRDDPTGHSAAPTVRGSRKPHLVTIPSSGLAFRKLVERAFADTEALPAEHLEARLRRLFPRATVRERALSGEAPTWYVYRDGQWRPPEAGPWWESEALPSFTVSDEGWVTAASEAALSILGLQRSEIGQRHVTDFVAPGALTDALNLFSIVNDGDDLTAATVLLRPTTGDVIAVDLHAARHDSGVKAVFRLAQEVPATLIDVHISVPDLVCRPDTDAAFARYAALALARMPEPTPDGLALRLRRLYPHAHVTTAPTAWVASRDAESASVAEADWWQNEDLPCVRYDAEALILDANTAAQELLGSSLVGHHWQEFVTPGSTDEVAAMLAILADVGAAESRFRMPGAAGGLVEFDSYTKLDGTTFTTIMRPRP
jgi:PAS domain-containing protein